MHQRRTNPPPPDRLRRRWRRLVAISLGAAAVLLALAAAWAGGGREGGESGRSVAVQPGAPGEPGRLIDPTGAAGSAEQPATIADVRFVQAMVAHHAQALELTGLVPGRTTHADLPLLSRRIEISQADEIALMEGWLEARGAAGGAGHDHGPAGLAPGMLTDQQLAELATATGTDFDRLFLESMIYHHEGALIMVEDLFAGGGGHQAELNQLVTHIDADQRIEIDRMHQLLAELPLRN